ncbi:MAG: GDP-L-fucose synthase [Desulfobacterium sp.]|nr:GDP-L-fucose synthase [Desulfobacterium sp.]
MDKQSKIFISGISGMVGSAIASKLLEMEYKNIVGSFNTRSPEFLFSDPRNQSKPPFPGPRFVKIDLTVQKEVDEFFDREKPDYVFMAGAKVGGIHANSTYPADFIYENLTIQGHIIHASHINRVKRLLFLGSSCIYPRLAPQPIKETDLLTGLLEPTNEPYAMAKIAGIKMCEAYNRQYGTRFIAVMPTNLYGKNDKFDLDNSHVLPALVRKFHDAKISGEMTVTVWGTGRPRREFMYIDDMAEACCFVMNLSNDLVDRCFVAYPDPCFINVGTGVDCTIAELAETIKKVVGFKGEIKYDTSQPDGMFQKRLDVSRLSGLGWKARVTLVQGVKKTYAWYLGQCGKPSDKKGPD